ALQVSAAVHRLIMIRLLLLTPNQWAWQRQCGAEVWSVSMFPQGSWFDSRPLTTSLLNLRSQDRRLRAVLAVPCFKNSPQRLPSAIGVPFNTHKPSSQAAV